MDIIKIFADLNNETTFYSSVRTDKLLIPVLYEDNHVLVAVKPPGVLSQSDKSGKRDMLSILKEYIKEKYNKPGNVFLGLLHRLDCPVGGVMVFARTSKGASRISQQIRERKVEKIYYAIVQGRINNTKGEITGNIQKQNGNKAVGASGGKEAKLSYDVLSEREGFSLVRIVLHTGRTHQIRLQLSEIEAPIVGDMKYGTGKPGEDPALFASSFLFEHPVKNLKIKISVKPKSIFPWKLFSDVLDSCIL